MTAADRSCLCTLRQALDGVMNSIPMVSLASAWRWMFTRLVGSGSRQSDPACRKTHPAFHVSDWLVPTTDLVNDRGIREMASSIFRQFVGWLKTPD